jgi:hypothetical protein
MRLAAVLVVVSLCVAAGAYSKESPKSINVDCGKGQSFNAALTDSAATLVVEFSGVCAEDVLITRSNVTVRGTEVGATIAGASPPAPAGPAVAVRNATAVLLKDFAVQDAAGRGIDVRAASAVTIDGIVSNGSLSDGLFVGQGSAVFIRNSNFDNNGGDGIGVWQNSTVTFEGTITLNGNHRAGLLLSGTSEGSVTFFGGHVSANDNSVCGFVLQLGAAAQLAAATATTVSASNNGDCGLSMSGETSWAGPLTVQNSPVGVDVSGATFESGALTVSGCEIGLFAHLSSFISLRAPSVTTNQFGLRFDGATTQINNAVITGNTVTDVRLQFGTRASFNSASTVGTMSCDGTELVRGPVTCPAATVFSGTKAAAPREPRQLAILKMRD